MKNTSKILALVLVLMTVLMSLSAITVSAADTTKIYLDLTESNWTEADAKFQAWTWGGSAGNKMIELTDPDGDKIYEGDLPAGQTYVIFLRHDPKQYKFGEWGGEWARSGDKAILGNCYKITGWAAESGTWTTIGSSCEHEPGDPATCTTAQICTKCESPIVAALGHDYDANNVCKREGCGSRATFTVAGSGAHLNGEWDPSNATNDMTYVDGVYTKVYTNVAAGSYQLKCVRDHSWTTSYGSQATASNPDGNYLYTVATAGSTVTVTLTGTTVDVKVEAPHVCEFSDPTCTEPGKCSCGETQGEPTGHKIEGRACANGCGLSLDSLFFWASDASYTVDGHNIKYSGLGNTYACAGSADVVLFAAGHNTLTITITNNGEADSRVRISLQGKKVANSDSINTGATGGDVWTDLEWGGSTVTVPAGQSVTLTITYDESTERGPVQNLVVFADSSRGDEATYSADITLSDITFSTVVPHVNKLEVGETNKIVVSGDYKNDYNLPIEWVPFVAEETANYAFVGTNGALAFIFDANGALISATGVANLEAGNYLICLGNGLVGEFNVAVTKSAWVNALAVGAGNKILITDAQDNGYGYYITWVTFEVTEKANYTFTGEGVLALVYDSANAAVTGTELEPGTYNICVAFLTPATTGVASVDVTKTPLSDEPVVTPTDPALQVGENTVTIDGTTTNYIGNAVAWLTFTPETSGTYTFASEELTAYIYAEKNMGGTALGSGVAELEAGVTYYVLVGKGGVTGEFVVTVSAGGEVVAPNTIVVGENHYVISDALYAVGFEFLELTVTEPGVYKVSGGAPMKVYLFTLPNTDLGTAGAGAFGWNVDALEEDGFADYFYVTLPEAGTYWFGVNYEYVTEEREFDITIELHTEHEYVEGKCECGAQEPVQEPDQPEQPGGDEPTDEPTTPAPELTLWDKIVAFIKRILAMLLGFFKK